MECGKQYCRLACLIRAGSAFFYYPEKEKRINCQLLITDVYMRIPARTVIAIVGNVSSHTVVDCNNYRRATCRKIVDCQPKLVGTREHLIKIDKTYMAGRRQYGPGRSLLGDKKQQEESKLLEDVQLPDWNQNGPPKYENSENKDKNTDFVLFRIDEPSWRWAVGFWASSNYCRFARVPNRSKRTLNSVINRYVESGSFIVTDMWGGYNDPADLGYYHGRLNNKKNYIDPPTGAHTNEIEGARNILKALYKRNHGRRKHLQSFVDEASQRMMKKKAEEQGRMFDTFIKDIPTVHSMNVQLFMDALLTRKMAKLRVESYFHVAHHLRNTNSVYSKGMPTTTVPN